MEAVGGRHDRMQDFYAITLPWSGTVRDILDNTETIVCCVGRLLEVQ
jgi:hypothetical protein